MDDDLKNAEASSSTFFTINNAQAEQEWGRPENDGYHLHMH